MNPSTQETAAYSIHADYQDTDADLVLLSSDEIVFRVHSFILKRASITFRDMLELSREQSERPEEPIRLNETSLVIGDLLHYIYPDSSKIPRVPAKFDHAVDLFTAMDKFQMPKAMAMLRKTIMAIPYSTKPDKALRIYVLACKFNWKEEAGLMLASTVKVELDSSGSLKLMRNLDEEQIAALTNIREQQEARMLSVCELLSTKALREAIVTDGKKSGCGRPSHARQLDARRASLAEGLKSIAATELDKSPGGYSLLSIGFWKAVDQRVFQEHECICRSCGKWLVDPYKLRKSADIYMHQHSLLAEDGYRDTHMTDVLV